MPSSYKHDDQQKITILYRGGRVLNNPRFDSQYNTVSYRAGSSSFNVDAFAKYMTEHKSNEPSNCASCGQISFLANETVTFNRIKQLHCGRLEVDEVNSSPKITLPQAVVLLWANIVSNKTQLLCVSAK